MATLVFHHLWEFKEKYEQPPSIILQPQVCRVCKSKLKINHPRQMSRRTSASDRQIVWITSMALFDSSKQFADSWWIESLIKKLTSHFRKNIVYQLSQDRHWYPQSESEDPSEAETEGKRKTGGTGPGSEKPKMRERGGLGPAGIMVMAVIITVLILMLLLCCDCRKPKLSRMIRKKRIWSQKTKTSAH